MNQLKFNFKPAAIVMIGALSLLSLHGFAEDKKTEPAPPPTNSGINQESTFPQIASGKWTGPFLPDGQPDVQGFWSNTIANHNNFTDPQGGIPGSGRAPKTPREQRAPSRVSDPASGEVPFQPWALEKVKEFQAHFHDPVEQQWVEPLARCAPGGVPKSFYWHGYEIRQYPGYVFFYFNSGTRLIHLNKKNHLPDNIKLWNGDSYGHWEGNTLVVDVKNHNGKALFGRTGEFISENGHIQERFIFSPDRKRFNYVAVFTDPTVYTKPFTVTIPARRWTENDEPNGWHFEVGQAKHKGKNVILEGEERICAENNAAFGMGAQ
ncbi:hypothetical protein LG198_05225 [Methylobacillus arboreus]|uniref:hypothetical protein n=1 Tax=Methylobacillus arboreus TaxID=755170 RepID=UPI001E2CC0DE|nr:hypothetical protein [Methylobacillus arboreus]MCB5190123.1 hypothetical protein [Methylobacillus arboreus]